ncbi:cytochrome P450 [Nocardia sp. NPDC005745]|uniref:cytochrome P450 n=1 Tax=Nocardia sp. NPDC005745 TaxID=3157061 RepID=UPI0033F93C40
MDLSDINLLDLDRYAEGPPLDWFAYLRAHAPVYRHPDQTERGFWALTKFDDIAKAAKTPTVFSSSYLRGGTIVLGHSGIDTMMGTAPRVMSNMDAPEHLKYRRLSTRAFTNKALDALVPAYRRAAAALIDNAMKRESVDFVTDIAAKLPVQAIGEMLGIPEEDRHLLGKWTDALTGSEDPELSRSPEEVAEANTALFTYGQQLRERRAEEPGDDLLSALIAAEVDDEGLTEEELGGFFALLVIAGAETSRNVLSHGLIGLLEDPDQYGMLHEDPSLAKDATEEILRWSPAVIYLGRHVTQDIEFGGQQMKEGDRVALFFASGNRDEDKFADADRFDIHRRPREHLAFGSGPHACLGAHLARIEIRVFYEELAQRASKVRITDKPSYLRSNLAGGVKHLPVALTPA